jgi:hypothetical protein
LDHYKSSGRHEGGRLGFSLRFAFQIQLAGGVDDGGNLKAGSKREIASVAPLLRNDSFLSKEDRWRCGVTRNDRWVGGGLERDGKEGGRGGPGSVDDGRFGD